MSMFLIGIASTAAFAPGGAGYMPRGLARASVVMADGQDPRAALGNALRGVADAALGQLETAMQEAAMQDAPGPAPVAASELAQRALEVQPLPDDFDGAVALALQSCAEALCDGNTRQVVEFDTSAGDETYPLLTRTMKLVQPMLPLLATSVLGLPAPSESDEEPPVVQLLFPDEGTSAYVAQKWELPPGTVCGSLPRAQLAGGVEALVLVAPGATEVPAVQRLLGQVEEGAPACPVFLFNPKLVDMQSTGYGLVGRELRTMVAEQFCTSFVLKSYPEGALFRTYPGGWCVWREEEGAEGGYTLAYEGAARPSGDAIDELLYPEEEGAAEGGGSDLLAGFGRFVKGFQAM